MEYDRGSFDVTISVHRGYAVWTDRVEIIQPWFESKLIHERVPELLEDSNLQEVFAHVAGATRGLGHASAEVTIHFQIERVRQPNGLAERIVFSAPAYPIMGGGDVVTGERIPLQTWLEMAVERLETRPPGLAPFRFQYLSDSYTETLIEILQKWRDDQLTHDQYTTSVQLSAWYGTTWDGGTGIRGRERRGYVSVPTRRFIQEATGDHAHYSGLYIQARRGAANPIQHMDSWIRAQGGRVVSAAEGYDEARTRLGETSSVSEQGEDSSLNDALATWLNSKRDNPNALLYYIANVQEPERHRQ